MGETGSSARVSIGPPNQFKHMKRRAEHKRKHHFIPKLYLKGFIEAKESPFVWVYERGRAYNPGHKRLHNPCRRPISKVGAEEDSYAFKKEDGTIDFDTYENELEKLEKPSNPIFAKLRRCEMLTAQEKENFASYVYLMYKRVPRRKERFRNSWPHVSSSMLSGIAQRLDSEEIGTDKADKARLARISELRSELEKARRHYEESIPVDTEIPLKSLVMKSPLGIPAVLSSMTWQFFIAPEGYGFLASDDPVFPAAMKEPYSEISFPISGKVALVMSWYDLDQGFLEATPKVVTEINLRTANRALHQVYYSRAEEWVVDAMEKSREGYYLLYPFQKLRLTEWYDLCINRNPNI
jgi:hypothetical protein